MAKRFGIMAGCLGLILSAALIAGGEPSKTNMMLMMRDSSEGINWESKGSKLGERDVLGTLEGLGSGESKVAYDLEGKFDVFECYVGYLSTVAKGRSCRFEVLVDHTSAYLSEPIESGTEPTKVRVPVKSAHSLILVIKPKGYGSTLGAAFADPVLLSGVAPEDMKQPLSLDINGKKSQIDLPGGVLPKDILVPVPLGSGSANYRVHIVTDTAKNTVNVVVDKAAP